MTVLCSVVHRVIFTERLALKCGVDLLAATLPGIFFSLVFKRMIPRGLVLRTLPCSSCASWKTNGIACARRMHSGTESGNTTRQYSRQSVWMFRLFAIGSSVTAGAHVIPLLQDAAVPNALKLLDCDEELLVRTGANRIAKAARRGPRDKLILDGVHLSLGEKLAATRRKLMECEKNSSDCEQYAKTANALVTAISEMEADERVQHWIADNPVVREDVSFIQSKQSAHSVDKYSSAKVNGDAIPSER